MTKIYSINSDVKFPDMEHYDMGKASDMALYLAHCYDVVRIDGKQNILPKHNLSTDDFIPDIL